MTKIEILHDLTYFRNLYGNYHEACDRFLDFILRGTFRTINIKDRLYILNAFKANPSSLLIELKEDKKIIRIADAVITLPI